MLQKDIPVIKVSGAPYERGRMHGEAAKERILKGVKAWKEFLHRKHLIKPDTYLKEFLANTNFKPAMEKWTPELLEEIRGVADGAGVDFDTMYAYQLADEEWVYGVKERQWKKEVETADHCSALGVWGQKDIPPYLAQNMDLPGWCRGHEILLDIDYGGSKALILTYAGFLATTGMNSLGLGICCNTLSQLDHCLDGLPVMCVVRRVLEMGEFDKAVEFVKSVKHASGQNYTIGTADKMGAFECSANKVSQHVYAPDIPRVFHTNHPMANDDTSLFTAYRQSQAGDFQLSGPNNSELRLSALETRLGKTQKTVEIGDIKKALRSHDDPHNPVCVDTAGVLTFGSVIYELGEAPKMHVTPGPPCRLKYRTFDLKK